MPVPETPPSIARRSPTGWGANSPGTDALAATARGSGTPVSRCNASRSPVYASTALTTRLRSGQRQVWVMSTTLDGSRLTSGVRAASAAPPMARITDGSASAACWKSSSARCWLGASFAAGANRPMRLGRCSTSRISLANRSRRPAAITVASTDPAEVPTTRSASPTATPRSVSSCRYAVSQATNTTPPPPSTSARSMPAP